MRECTRTLTVVLTTLLAAAGCADSGTGPLEPDVAFDVNGSGRLAVYNGGVDRAVPGSPCAAPEHRQFDFWVGEWNVTGQGQVGGPVSTNIVENLLDGCVIQENWTAANGSRGRSINAYDPDTGEWHQTWVSAFDTGHLRMSGGWTGTIMAMDGVRTQTNGVQWLDSYTWTPIGPDELVQAGRLQIPVINLDIQFALTYLRSDNVMPAAEVQTANCMAGGRSSVIRGADFWQGDWNVLRENGQHLGTSQVTSDLSGCLTVEKFATSKGYGAISYVYYDLVESRMYRTYIDSEGERMELSGAFEGEALVLTGNEPGPDGAPRTVRMTLEPVSADAAIQRFEVSSDGGATWHTDLVLHYVR